MVGIPSCGVLGKRELESLELSCPHPVIRDGMPDKCGSVKVRFVNIDEIDPYRIRYQCKSCLRKFICDFSCDEKFLRLYKNSSKTKR